MANQIPFINGVQPSWGSIKINLLSRTVTGVKNIEYSDPQTKEHIMGAGNHPVGRGNGNYEPTASLELLEFETRGIMSSLPPGERLQDIPPFNIVVTYQPRNQKLLRTDIIRNCQFKSNGVTASQGDTELTHTHEMICSHIDYNV